MLILKTKIHVTTVNYNLTLSTVSGDPLSFSVIFAQGIHLLSGCKVKQPVRVLVLFKTDKHLSTTT